MTKLMLFGCSLLFLFAILVNNCDAYPYQFLPTRDGYVPVYIRVGDTPLNEINPELAVAFHEVAAVNGRQLKSDDEFVSNPTEIKVAQVEQKADQIENKKQIEHSKPTPVEHSA